MITVSSTNPLASADGADAGVCHQSPELESAICYRLEPTKRMWRQAGVDRLPGARPVPHGHDVPPCLLCRQSHTVLNLEKVRRVALMVTPEAAGAAVDQAWEAIATIRAILKQQTVPMTVTSQTVFLRRAEDEEPCLTLMKAWYRNRLPATTFVVQPPCGGQALAIEAWALGGAEADVQFPYPNVVTAAYDGLRWIHVGGVSASEPPATTYAQASLVFQDMTRRLERTGASWSNVVRTWLYLGGITEPEAHTQRYRELNRARTDFFAEQEAAGRMTVHRGRYTFYPASTGIGTAGRGLAAGCLALQTLRDDVRLQPLENPQQTPAFDYAASYSAKSPKFSRAMAVVIGDYVTTWVSGTASIVHSESVFAGDVERQTEQAIDNIEALIGPENFARHGIPGAGAKLRDLAKIRVYVKRGEDFEKCRAVCERRFGPLPAVYAQADVCRPELLVEIEGVAFSRVGSPSPLAPGAM